MLELRTLPRPTFAHWLPLLLAAPLLLGAFPASAVNPSTPTYLQTFSDAATADNGFDATDGKRYFDVDAEADQYGIDLYERPTAQTFEVRNVAGGGERFGASEYLGYLDIVTAKVGFDADFLYVAIELAGRSLHKDDGSDDPKGLLSRYGFRLSTDPHGAGGLLLVSDQPEAKNSPNTTFGTEGVFGYRDTNGDVGGAGLDVTKGDQSSESNGDGFEDEIIADGKQGGTEVLWVRIDPSDPHTVEFALDYAAVGFSQAQLQDLQYLEFEAIEGGPDDPQNYLWNDEYTPSEAGSPNRATSGDTSKSEFGTQGLGDVYGVDTARGGPLLVPPTIAISVPADGALLGVSAVAVSGVVSEPVDTVDVNGVAATVTGGVFSASVTLADGVHPLIATATNGAGQASDTVTVTVDTTAPVVTITAPPNGTLTSLSLVAVAGTVADGTPIATFQINGQDVPLASGSFQVTLAIPLDQTSVITAVAVDAAGNTGSDAVSVTHGLPPTVTIDSPVDGSRTADGSVLVAGTVNGTGTPAVEVNGVAVPLTAGAFSTTVPLALGDNPIAAVATNAFGQASDQVSVFRGELPTVQITSPSDGVLTNQTSATVSGSVTGLPVAAVDVNGVVAPVSAGSFSVAIGLLEGANTLTATAANEFGTAGDTISATLDTTPPLVNITTPIDGALTAEAQVLVEGTVIDASPIASFQINGQAVALVGSSFSITLVLAPGVPTVISAVAVDAVGNEGSDSVTVTFESGPLLTISIDTPPDGALVSSATIAVAGSLSEPNALVDVNGVSATVVDTAYVVSAVGLVEGPNVLSATASLAGQTAVDSITVLYNAPPEVVITSPADQSVVNQAETDVRGFVDDAAAFVDVNGIVARVDSGGQFVAEAVPLAGGDNVLTARAVDPFGATGTDAVQVARDDATIGKLRVVLVLPERFPFSFEVNDQEGVPPTVVVAENGLEFGEALEGLGLLAGLFDREVEDTHLGFDTSLLHIYVFSEFGVVGQTVSVPAIFDRFFNGGDQAPLQPISALASGVSSAGFAPGIISELSPDDFDPNGFAHFEVFIGVGN